MAEVSTVEIPDPPQNHQFYDGRDAANEQAATAEARQAESVAQRLADLHTQGAAHDKALGLLLRRGFRVSADTYLVVGDLPAGQYKNIYLPDIVKMDGLWKVDSITAMADKSASVDLQVTIRNFPPGIDWNLLASKTPLAPINYAQAVERIIRPQEYEEIAIALANGAAGDKCVVTFNLERVA